MAVANEVLPSMVLFNLCGGPGSGKSTIASFLHAYLKLEGVRAELVGEEAKEIVFDQLHSLFTNQVLITGRQWQRVLRHQQSETEIAISDSPLIQGILYAEHHGYFPQLKLLTERLEELVPETFNIFIRRVKPYSTHGRYQTESEAKEIDIKASKLIKHFWLEIPGDLSGGLTLVSAVLKHLNRKPLVLGEALRLHESDLAKTAPTVG